MAITLYFAKLNLETEEIYNLYKKPQKRVELAFALSESLKKESCWEKISHYPGEDGVWQTVKIQYQLHILSIDEDLSYAEGWLYKISKLHYNSLDETSNKLTSQSVFNTEAIRFVLDIQNELIGYDTKNRFGYKEFLEAFVNVINMGLKGYEPKMEFNINLCSKGISLDDIKKGLEEIGVIKELQFKIQPPNPKQELLDHLQELGESRLGKMQEANVTQMETTLRSKGGRGLNLDSDLISAELNKLQGIHAKLPVEEANRNGYLKVNAISKTGRKFSSGEAKPFKKIIESLAELKDACKDAFTELISE